MAEKLATRLIVFSETILGWYYKPDEPEAYQRRVAETIPGNATEMIGEMAKLYNSPVLLNPNGELQAVHRKVRLIDWDVESGFSEGNQETIVEIDGIKAGIIICADVQSYEQTKELVKENIQLLIHSLASEADEFQIDPVARQFNSWVIFSNRYNVEGEAKYSGLCYIADPAGTIRIGEEGGERYLFYRIGICE